jgi:alpha-mannosidase
MNRNSADRLVQAAALFAVRAANSDEPYPAADFADAWRNVLLYSEHTWGAWNSVSDSENKFVTDQWNIKRSFALNADKQSRDLLIRAAAPSPKNVSQVYVTNDFSLEVHNTNSWPRSGLVVLPKEMSPLLDPVISRRSPNLFSQRLSTGDLALWIDEILPFSSFNLLNFPGAAPAPRTPVTVNETILDNGILSVRVDPKTGAIAELLHHASNHNFVDASASEQLNSFLYLAGADLSGIQTNGPATIAIEDPGPLVATLRIESAAPGCNRLIRKIRLVAGADHVEISNIVDKQHAPLNPNPGNSDQAGAWAQHGGKESLQFAFPFNVQAGQIRIDIPLGVMRPDLDQLPGSCKNWLPVGRWIDVSNDHEGITWVTLDAPLVELGSVSANLLGSQRDPGVWRNQIPPTQKIYSWVMNNHWGTNYRAYQEGPVEFRYALRPHAGYDPAAAARFATALSQPLIVAQAVNSKSDLPPFLRVEPDDVLVTSLKPSDDGKAWIVRLFGASGEDRNARLIWSATMPKPRSISITGTDENPGAEVGEAIPVAGWDLVSVRVEKS